MNDSVELTKELISTKGNPALLSEMLEFACSVIKRQTEAVSDLREANGVLKDDIIGCQNKLIKLQDDLLKIKD